MNTHRAAIFACCMLALGCSSPKPTAQARDAFAGSLSKTEVAQIRDYHNTQRAQLGIGPLRWSDSLAKFAAEWADTLAGRGCNLEHRRDSPYGENLFIGTLPHYGVEDAARAWAEEQRHYAGGALSESNWLDSGHYTQMVWRNTREVGCAKSVCDGSLIVVCNYDPPGNFMGEKPY